MMLDESATVLLRRLRSGELGACELLDAQLARIEAHDPGLNAVVLRDPDRARRTARAADAARVRGAATGPLHGLPMTVKETFDVAGLPTTSGTPRLRDNLARTDAVTVARLREAGAVIFGKTNTAELAGDLQTNNPVYGLTRNPWDPERTCGGSSGGSAVALACGFTSLELGSDIGGSIRVPAHFCGICGHKPSYGLVPPRGHVPGPPGWLAGTDIAVVGPLARRVEDLALALDLLAGPDQPEAIAWRLRLPEPRTRNPRQWRVAAWLDDAAFPVERESVALLEGLCVDLRVAGVTVDDAARPAGIALESSHALFYRLLNAALGAGLDRDAYREAQCLAEETGTAEDSEQLRFARSATMSHRRWVSDHDRRLRLAAAWQRFFTDYDVLLCPVAQVAAFPHDDGQPLHARQIAVDGGLRPYAELTVWPGLAGGPYLPATVVPVGRTRRGLPVGVQVIGPRFGDRMTLAVAAFIETLGRGFVPPPLPPRGGGTGEPQCVPGTTVAR